jgi:hypothetical protein
MRYAPALLLLTSLISTPLAAQEFRLSGGYNGTNVAEAGTERWSGRPGYQFGADLQLGSRWFVRPGIHFVVSSLNYTVAAAPELPQQDFTYTSRALRIPVVLGFNLLDASDDPAFNVNVFGGPSALMNLNADLDQDEFTADTSPAQWYLGFGAGIAFGFLFADVGYDVAMSNVFDGDAFQTNPKANFLHAKAGVRLVLAE